MTRNQQSESLIDSLWELFASVKLTVVVLILLAATSVIGTLIPQNADPASYMRAFGALTYRLLQIFDIFNMYYSWWFQALIATLALNITICTIKRWPAIWKIVSSPNINAGGLAAKRPLADFSDTRSPEKLEALYLNYLKSKFRNHKIESEKSGFRLVAEKGRWTRLGVPAVHLSIVIILAGALIGSIFGFDGFVNIPEGGTRDFIRLRNSSDTLSLGFEVRCDDFDVSFYDSGSPKEFRSSLVVLENGSEVVKKDIIVNDPLRYKGINFFQSSYGLMPPKDFQITFSSANSDKKFQHKVSIGDSVKLPDGKGRFTARQYVNNYNYRGVPIGEALLGVIEKPGKGPEEIALPMRFPTFDKMRKGQWLIQAEGHDTSYYTGLQVTKDPGVALVYFGFSLLILGCWVTFFMSHKKIMVDVRPSTNSSRIQLFGTANRNRLGFEIAMRKLGDELSRL
ncbi:MAG: cytochrome c biogenesis protein ResB [Deltaproteobacteria bacterium]|nr:cytochrome c biogenesis protein ResB [Deltaproteobacteria bacterium]